VDVTFFVTPADLRAWFDANHQSVTELLIGFHKVASGRPSVTWPEAVDEALCVGWIDGIRRRIDDSSYSIRFTPRRKRGIWSAINIGRVSELQAAGRMRPAGERAFEARDEARSAIYAYEQPPGALAPEEDATFRANGPAWAWFSAQAPSYQRTATYWIVSARKPETRVRRLETLIADSAAGRTIKPLTRPTPKESP
jgi:uncharacterized protein YdeI (YjbR/CyaY-like superfamily)